MGTTVSAIIRIRNSTATDIVSITAFDIDFFDFGDLRPEKIFKETTIPSFSCIEKTIDFSVLSSTCPFSMKVLFKNGSADIFRMNYKSFLDGHHTQLSHSTKSHVLKVKQTGPRVVEIIFENTEEQIEDQNAQKLIEHGCKLMDLGKYNEASVKFMEAAQKANDNHTILDLQKSTHKLKTVKETTEGDKRAKSLNNEGMQLLRSVQFQDAVKKFDEALKSAKSEESIALIEDNLKIAKDAKMNQDAKKLNQEGLLLRKSDHEAAIMKFDAAIEAVVDTSILNSIQRNKAETLVAQAEEMLTKAWTLELCEESIHLFAKAKFLFQEADSVKHHVSYQEHVSSIDCKLEGDRLFSVALQHENEGSRLIDKTVSSEKAEDCAVAKKKYEEAWKCYKEALKKYEEGGRNGGHFNKCVTVTREAMNGIETILSELEKAEIEIAVANR